MHTEELVQKIKTDLLTALATKAELEEQVAVQDDRILELRSGYGAISTYAAAQAADKQEEETDGDDASSIK